MDARETHGDYNYQPNRAQTTIAENPAYDYSPVDGGGPSQQKPIRVTDDYRQAGELYRSLSQQDRDDLITNLVHDLSQITNPDIKIAAVSNFYKADKDYGTRLVEALHLNLQQVVDRAATL